MALTGPYATQALALAACADYAPCCDTPGNTLADHPDLELVVSGGTYAGTYTLAWDGTNYIVTFLVGGETLHLWRLNCSGGTWTLSLYEGEGTTLLASETSTNGVCDPFSLSFSQTNFGADSPLTVAVA